MRQLFVLSLLAAVSFSIPINAEAVPITFYDNYEAWAQALNEPTGASCMTSQACYPSSFGTSKGLGGTPGPLGIVLSDQDWFFFSNAPSVKALAFDVSDLRGRVPGLVVSGLGLGQTSFYSSTGFIGFVGSQTWSVGTIFGAPHTDVVLTQMYFNAGAAPGFVNTAAVPEPTTLAYLLLACGGFTLARRAYNRKA